MKTAPIQQQIVQNYNRLKQIAGEPVLSNREHWGLNYRNNMTKGFVGETGCIKRNNAEIKISNNGDLNLIKKPFLSTWKHTLKNINKMLEDITVNYNNKDVVNKKVVKILCFSKEASERLAEIASKIKR